MAGGGRGTGPTPMPKDGTGPRYVRDTQGNLWRWKYWHGIFYGMDKVEEVDPPAVRWWDQAKETAGAGAEFLELVKQYWKPGLIIIVLIFILTSRGK